MAELDSISSRSNSSVYDVVDTSISTSTSEESSEAPKNSRWTKVKQNASIAAEKTKQGCGNYWSNVFTVATLKRKLPIIGWLPNYRPSHLKGDLIAGLTVGLTVIPQGMAYAALAGLDLQYGLYSSFMGCFIYCLMGTSKDITMGPTAIMSILASEYARDQWSHSGEGHGENTNVTLAIMLCFLTGIIQILMAVFRLGFLVRYISHPVITGFTCSSAIIIAGTQLNKIFGIDTPRGFFQTIITICKDIAMTKHFDLIMGVTCMIVLYFLKFAKQRWSDVKEGDKTIIIILKKTLWFIATARNAIVVIVCALIAFGLGVIKLPPSERYLTLTKNITGGLPPFKLPDFTYTTEDGETYYFDDMLASLNIGLLMVPLIAFLEAIAIAKSFGRKNKYKVDSQQELLSIGVSNFLSSFVSAYPITGSFGRSAVNAQCNVMTPMGGLVTGTIVILALEFLSEAFQYIPSSALGAVIIMAVINLFDYGAIKSVAKVNLIDLLPLLTTFICCFWDIAYGIMIGIGVSLLILLLEHAMPRARSSQEGDTVTITLKKGLDFPGAEAIENKLQKQADKDCKQVIMDCANLTSMDYSAAEAFYHGAEALKNANIMLKFAGLRRSQKKILTKVGIAKYGTRFYDNVKDALADSIFPPEEKDFPMSDMCYVNEVAVDDELGFGEKKNLEGSAPPSVDFSQKKTSSSGGSLHAVDIIVDDYYAESDLSSVEDELTHVHEF